MAGSVTFWSLLSNETAPRPVWNSASRLSPNCPLSLAGLVWEGPGLPPHRGSGQGPEGVGSSVLVAMANVTAGSRHGASVVTRSWLSPCRPPSSHRGWAPAGREAPAVPSASSDHCRSDRGGQTAPAALRPSAPRPVRRGATGPGFATVRSLTACPLRAGLQAHRVQVRPVGSLRGRGGVSVRKHVPGGLRQLPTQA